MRFPEHIHCKEVCTVTKACGLESEGVQNVPDHEGSTWSPVDQEIQVCPRRGVFRRMLRVDEDFPLEEPDVSTG
jgi:hypothetical protein